MRIADFPRPRTPAAVGAVDLARQYQHPAVTEHAIRSWLWAEAFAVVDGVHDVDHELLFVAAVLHDIGLATEYDNHTSSYEHAGGHVAVALTAGAGWSADRRQRVLEVVVRHNWVSVDPHLDVEGHLLETATSLDISGLRPDDLPHEFLLEVLVTHPRTDLADVFTACVTDQADRKPTTAARRLVGNGLAQKLQRNPLEHLA